MKQNIARNYTQIFLASFFLLACNGNKEKSHKIDRFKLVTRHNVVLSKVDTLGSLSVGNGEFAFTVDASGLQTFPEEYEDGISLGTQSQWAWHSIPSKSTLDLNDVAKEFESCDGTKAPYAVQRSDDPARQATDIPRANPAWMFKKILI